MYTQVFSVLSRPVQISATTQRSHMAEHAAMVSEVYRQIGLVRVAEVHQALCWQTRHLDPNEEVQTLLCLAGRESRLDLEGCLGGALVIRTMNEFIRRMTERTFHTQLPEEDEHSTSWGMATIKERNYGARRLLDGEPAPADEFARTFGLRYGPYIRWYVEGDTEYGAVHRLRTLLGAHDLGVVNLRGVVESKGFGVITEHLKADNDARIFSFVSIDGDVPGNVKVLQAAARADIFCGAFFISRPNFECHNFSRAELEELVWSLACKHGADGTDYEAFRAGIVGWDADPGDIEELFRRAREALLLYQGLQKGVEWGELLMEYAWDHPAHPSGGLRDIMQTIRLIGQARITNYHLMHRDYRVDESSGQLVPRL